MIASPDPLSPIPVVICVAFVAVLHIAFLYSKGLQKKKTISLEQFEKEPQWIPRAVISLTGQRKVLSTNVNYSREQIDEIEKTTKDVEVQYGVPTVAYIGFGYLVYLLYIAATQPHLLLMP